ncbi:penicillin acylase family protein [Pandoraea sp. NPDC087047]|uniref:penicillin acylase family protein n=1 Tax=Pandoraea sp. NPDC087047 TaxID=3364390 RepID=UPI003826D4B8
MTGVAAAADGVEIRRTTDGIPHVRADDWHALGVGVGYVQAQDALCTLAEGFLTFAGERSRYFGADARPARNATFGRPRNIELDTFFRSAADDMAVARFASDQPRDLNTLIEGFADGYNRYLREARSAGQPASCVSQPWVREISSRDIYRRMVAAQLAAGLARFIPEIANAQPPGASRRTADTVGEVGHSRPSLRARLEMPVGDQPGLGSNALAFGGAVTGGQGGVLLGNPHWYWGGPDRFYQMHLTIPGKMDVAGVAFLGIPVVMIGFNADVAWSHTVSAARRFGLFDLTLDPSDPTHYRWRGESVPMEARTVTIDVRDADGEVRQRRRTLYRTRFGPVIDLGGHHAAFAWGHAHALAIRDINAENFRIFRNFFYWNQAKSLDDFIAIERREAAVPWVNTLAIGRGDNRVWYGDVGAAPNVPDAQRGQCATALSKAFATVDPLTPVLDGSEPACDWQNAAGAVQAGAMPAEAMPSLLRDDYVANMNDSYWLTNPRHPLEGYPRGLGGERQPLSLRSRLGFRMADEIAASSPGSAAAVAKGLMARTLDARVYSADLFKDALLVRACMQPSVRGEGDAGDVGAAGEISLKRACALLRRWDNTGGTEARGALLWSTFWTGLAKPPMDEFYRVTFSADDPLNTPRVPAAATGGQEAARALALAVRKLTRTAGALGTPLGVTQFVRTEGQRVPLYGGCQDVGYFAVTCNADHSPVMGPDTHGNSYLQVVYFDANGVQARTLLAHGLQDTAVDNGAGGAAVRRYARKDWLPFPFREADIARDPHLRRITLGP